MAQGQSVAARILAQASTYAREDGQGCARCGQRFTGNVKKHRRTVTCRRGSFTMGMAARGMVKVTDQRLTSLLMATKARAYLVKTPPKLVEAWWYAPVWAYLAALPFLSANTRVSWSKSQQRRAREAVDECAGNLRARIALVTDTLLAKDVERAGVFCRGWLNSQQGGLEVKGGCRLDPDETLRLLRACVLRARAADEQEDDAAAMLAAMEAVQHMESLDEWMSKGGFPPKEWRRGQ